jgi:hypothetical protein
VKDAVDETGLPMETFPNGCPYASDAVLDEGQLPETSFGTTASVGSADRD